MNLEKKLALWENKKLISAVQKQQIVEFEKNNKNPLLFNAFICLGIFLISLGIISLVAANWDAISGIVKIAIYFTMMSGVVYGTFKASQKNKNIWFESGIVAIFMLTGAGIGLIGQVFQTNGSLTSAGILWSIITLPLLIISKRKILPFLWLPLAIGSIANIASFWKLLEAIFRWWFWDRYPEAALLTILFHLAVLAIFFTMCNYLTDRKYPIFDVARLYAYIFMYYTVIVFMFLGYETNKTIMFINIYAIVTIFFITLAIIGEKFNRPRQVNFNIVMLYVEFMFIYFRLFGSLITTGIGMIVSGLLLIGGIYLTRNIIRKLKTLR